jgi:hypothetical protein
MHRSLLLMAGSYCLLLAFAADSPAAGLLADRTKKVTIEGNSPIRDRASVDLFGAASER